MARAIGDINDDFSSVAATSAAGTSGSGTVIDFCLEGVSTGAFVSAAAAGVAWVCVFVCVVVVVCDGSFVDFAFEQTS